MAYDPRIGKQITYFEEPDTIVLRLQGEVTREEGFEINRRHAEWGRGRDRIFFLVGLEKLEQIDPEVRKAATSTMAGMQLRGMVGFAAPLRARVLTTLIFTALSMFSQKAGRIPLEFCDTEAEARQWIAARRGALDGEAALPAGEVAHGS